LNLGNLLRAFGILNARDKEVGSLFVTPPMDSGAFRASAGTIPGRSRKDSRPLFFSDPGMVKLCREDSEIAPLLKGILVELSFNGKSKKNIQLPKPGSVSFTLSVRPPNKALVRFVASD